MHGLHICEVWVSLIQQESVSKKDEAILDCVSLVATKLLAAFSSLCVFYGSVLRNATFNLAAREIKKRRLPLICDPFSEVLILRICHLIF
jgi:hypothetical protein